MKREQSLNKVVSLVLTSILLSSCGGSKSSSGGAGNDVTKVEEESNSSSEVSVSKDLAYSYKRRTEFALDSSNLTEFKKDLNTFTVKARSSTRSFLGGEIVCSKLLFDQRHNLFTAKFDDRGEFASVDIHILDSDPIRVDFSCYVNHEGKLSDAFLINLKKSFVVSGEESLNSLGIGNATAVETLLIEEGARLTTEGKKLNLSVNELISLSGEITTFRKETLKEKLFDVDGDGGGVIELSIQKGIGNLVVNMQGRDGGQQTRIRPQKLALRADPALNGQCRKGPVKSDNQACFGKDGQNGSDAEPGFPGFRGGNSGKLLLTILDARLLNFKVEFNPGMGSMSTPSTLPTEGQPGGIGSHVKWRTGGCSEHAGGGHGGRGMKTVSISDGKEFSKINGVSDESLRRNTSGFGVVSLDIDNSKFFSCEDMAVKFPDGKKGQTGKTLPVEMKALDGANGAIESAELNINNHITTIQADWSSEEL